MAKASGLAEHVAALDLNQALEVYTGEASKCSTGEPLCDSMRRCMDSAAHRVLSAAVQARTSSTGTMASQLQKRLDPGLDSTAKIASRLHRPLHASSAEPAVLMTWPSVLKRGCRKCRAAAFLGVACSRCDAMSHGLMAATSATIAIAVAVLGSAALTFIVPSRTHEHQALQDVASRRSLLGAVVASPLLGSAAPALAADKTPGKLESYGLSGKRAKDVNGLWSVFPDKKVNGRADDADIYLTYSDCQQFQMVKKPTGECEGFALEYKGVWEVDGEDTRMKVKPYQSKEDRKRAQQPVPWEACNVPSGGGGFFQLGKIEPIIPKQETQTDAEVLLNGQDVNEYVRRKGSTGMMGMQDYLTNMMTLEEEESKIADSLEARLDAKLKDRDISKNTAFYADRLDCCCRHGAPGPLEGKDSLVMAEEATGEAAVPEDSGDEFQEDAEEQGLEDEDLEEEEPEDDEEIAPGPGGGASKNDTLDMLADMSDLSGFGASGKSASASHSRRVVVAVEQDSAMAPRPVSYAIVPSNDSAALLELARQRHLSDECVERLRRDACACAVLPGGAMIEDQSPPPPASGC
eukprot:s3555_g10.t1